MQRHFVLIKPRSKAIVDNFIDHKANLGKKTMGVLASIEQHPFNCRLLADALEARHEQEPSCPRTMLIAGDHAPREAGTLIDTQEVATATNYGFSTSSLTYHNLLARQNKIGFGRRLDELGKFGALVGHEIFQHVAVKNGQTLIEVARLIGS